MKLITNSIETILAEYLKNQSGLSHNILNKQLWVKRYFIPLVCILRLRALALSSYTYSLIIQFEMVTSFILDLG